MCFTEHKLLIVESVRLTTSKTLLPMSSRNTDRVANRYYALPRITGFCPIPLIGYSQLTSISGGRSPIRNLGCRWMGVFITTSSYQFSDIDEEMWAYRILQKLCFLQIIHYNIIILNNLLIRWHYLE